MPTNEPAGTTTPTIMDQLSDYELKRLENIRRNQEVLAALNIPAAIPEEAPVKRLSKPARTTKATRHRSKRIREEPPPQRQSARLRGKKAEPHSELPSGVDYSASNRRMAQARKHIEGDVELAQAVEEFGRGGQRHFGRLLERIADAGLGPQCTPETAASSAADIADLRKGFTKLRVHHLDDGTFKVTPKRIYCTAFHPGSRLLVAAGDRDGTLGFWDADATVKQNESASDLEPDAQESQEAPRSIRQTSNHTVSTSTVKDEDEDADEQEDPVYTYTAHNSTISSLKYTPDGSRLFTSSYDGTIRYLDLSAQKFALAYAYKPTPNSDDPREMLIGSVDFDPASSDVVWFSSNEGQVGRCDVRMPVDSAATIHNVLDKKIGCVSMNRAAGREHWLATASLDRVLRIWDVRKLSDHAEPLAEFAHGRAVISAYWSGDGHRIVSSSYDDTLRIFDMTTSTAPTLDSPISIRHNCQTGRWVTMLRPHWIQPAQHHPSFLVANMSRSVDVFSGVTGELLWKLTAPEILTAVPAAVAHHPYQSAVVGGTASGRMLIWS